MSSIASEQLRIAACLVHTVPGAALAIQTTCGERWTVAHNRSGAALDPCQLRAAVAAPANPGVPHLVDVINGFEIVGGLVDIGGGLFQRSHPCTPDERWFGTVLAAEGVTEIVAGCPLDLPTGAIDVVVKSDPVLAASAVRVGAAPGHGYRLDEAAFWLHAACMVGELIACTRSERTR